MPADPSNWATSADPPRINGFRELPPYQLLDDRPLARAIKQPPWIGTLPAIADARDGTLGNFPLTELGTAERLIDKHGRNLRFVPESAAWLVWQDDRWVWDADASAVRSLVADLHKDIYLEGCPAGHDAKHFLRWARLVQSKTTVHQIVSLASDNQAIRLPLGSIDGKPLLVGLQGARLVLDLETGRIRAAERGDLVTRSLSVPRLGTTERAVRWRRFLDEVFQGDAAIIDWVQRYLGYALTGLTCEHLFVFAWGGGANGKSVFVSLCQHLWSDYARGIQPESLMNQTRSGSGPSPDLARLAGARLVLGSETEEGRALAESLIKQLTGGDLMTARQMYGRPFEFLPVMKLMLAGNHRPTVRGTDSGIWRRMRLLTFDRSFGPGERDPRLLEALVDESEHVAAWLLDGYRAYAKRGLSDVPDSMAAATRDYRTDEDIIGQWIDEQTSPAGSCLLTILYNDYRIWCAASGQTPQSKKALGQQLRERGLSSSHTRNGSVHAGICLRHVTM
ncbi:MAG: hypothetical protein K2Y04_10830 [Caulobacteraceae bacterium]|nr:hypothetical protein [Caulobacteraceae bacterium]